MCAIVDANVSGEVFGDNKSEAGQFFFDWLTGTKKSGKLVIGGRLRQELGEHGRFRAWLVQASLAGRARQVDDQRVDAETEALQRTGVCQSNDWHILGLARVSGARLLFSNDLALQQDFTNPQIVGGVRGKVFTTVQRKDIRPAHKNILRQTDLCDT